MTQIGTSYKMPVTGEKGALALWLVSVPGIHAFWDHWSISVVSLRDIPGVPPAIKKYPQAEYEIIVMAIEGTPSTDSITGWTPLNPVNVAEQIHGITDEQAIAITEDLVLQVTLGWLIPEPQGITGAREMWQDAIRYRVEKISNQGTQDAVDAAVREMKGEGPL